ncbi:transporter [Corynebacterium breve]|uniref:Transporter n=1 Tax=Corynebacterium breve TaxID=3049799 RepID=A0ABY8VE42_9CORY|nr:transporter [Corynebacterium breve]WIM67015.1 transporter [Corynebacterium breve]
MLEFLLANKVLLLSLLVGFGMLVGRVRIRGIALGAAAVLFLAIIVSAIATSNGQDLTLGHELSQLGLVLFTFSIGVSSGPNFFHVLKISIGPIVGMVVVFVTAAVAAVLVGRVMGLDIATIAGVFAGATTNTPALAAAGDASGDETMATIGYAISYIFGVLGMLGFALLALSKRASDTDAPAPLINRTLRVERTDVPVIEDVQKYAGGELIFSRISRGSNQPVEIPEIDTRLNHGDLVTVVGTQALINRATQYLGHTSSHSLMLDRRQLDFRRITLSNRSLVGLRVEEVDERLAKQFGAYMSRIRRGDTDLLAENTELLQIGDRIRVVAPRDKMEEIGKYFGDSTRGLTDINPVALGLGIALGIFIGQLPIPMPGGSFSIGAAAGALFVGLVFGRVGRIGNFTTSLPYTVTQVLSELGLLMFLAAAGVSAGTQILAAFQGGAWLNIALLGVIVTLIVGGGMYLVMRLVFRMGGTKLSGALAGAQTQPAVLAFANDRTNNDPRVAMGYATMYPVAMIVKILIAQIVGGL